MISKPYHSQGNEKIKSALKIIKYIMTSSMKNKENSWLNVLNTPTINMDASLTDKLLKPEIQISIPDMILWKEEKLNVIKTEKSMD